MFSLYSNTVENYSILLAERGYFPNTQMNIYPRKYNQVITAEFAQCYFRAPILWPLKMSLT